MAQAAYDLQPTIPIDFPLPCAWEGTQAITSHLRHWRQQRFPGRALLAVDCYPGVLREHLLPLLETALGPAAIIDTESLCKAPAAMEAMLAPCLGDDPVFGSMSGLSLADFFDPGKLAAAAAAAARHKEGMLLVYGPGAALVAPAADALMYADMPRWEIQRRFRSGEAGNLFTGNAAASAAAKYKRGFFVDWRVCDRHKDELFDRVTWFLDTTDLHNPKVLAGDAMRAALDQVVGRPFRVVPLFDPAPWGGQWMRQQFHLPAAAPNFGWGFDCVPEENSLRLRFGDVVIETPASNLVHQRPQKLLGETIFGRFGAEFPIRFDFLDTVGGGNLSFQVHPLTSYVQRQFGLSYTQDESYYILHAAPEAAVYLGLQAQVDRNAMAADLYAAKRRGASFDVDRYAQRFKAQRHDHFLIPAGTCHCSGAGNVVLEISATPYIFTFKMWDWGRPGLDGAPRPVHLEHALANIDWRRCGPGVRQALVNRFEPLSAGDGWREERTGLHETQFIETRRHWFSKAVPHDTAGTLHVLNLVQGDEAVVESPAGTFEPFTVHFAETFIVPAAVGPYTVRPARGTACPEHATVKAFVRS